MNASGFFDFAVRNDFSSGEAGVRRPTNRNTLGKKATARLLEINFRAVEGIRV